MNIFQLKTNPHGIPRFRQFIDEGFICIGHPGLGNLEGAGLNEIRSRIASVTGLSGHKLGNALGQVNAFVNTMRMGDIVLIVEKNKVFIGTIGNYYYEEQYDNETDAMAHRRLVEWTDRVALDSLNASMQRFLSGRNTISRYPESYEESGLALFVGANPIPTGQQNSSKLDSLFDEALAVLESELRSEDPDRRLKAATELIRLKKG